MMSHLEKLKKLNYSFLFQGEGDFASYQEDPVYQGGSDALLHVTRDLDLSKVLKDLNKANIPVTLAGSQTSLTGASVAHHGVVLAFDRLNKVLDLKVEEDCAIMRCEPGVLLGNLKKEALHYGYFYAPDPTSYKDVQLGGSVGTNATGEDSFLFGSTREHIVELKVLRANGERLVLRREGDHVFDIKNKAGYCLTGDRLDQIIGSEGTLALIEEITVKLIKQCYHHFALLVPFASFKDCLNAVEEILKSGLNPQACELIGPGAFEIFTSQEGVGSFHPEAQCLLYIKQHVDQDHSLTSYLEKWFKFIETLYLRYQTPQFIQDILVADTEKKLETFRSWRHFIPLTANERARLLWPQGGKKISTDWWVPKGHIEMTMLACYESVKQLEVETLVFGHIGNGHPHWNYFPENPSEVERVEKHVLRQLKIAASLGGGVAGEHGIGKIHHDYLPLQHDALTLKKMRDLKAKWDPWGLLGRGNIFK